MGLKQSLLPGFRAVLENELTSKDVRMAVFFLGCKQDEGLCAVDLSKEFHVTKDVTYKRLRKLIAAGVLERVKPTPTRTVRYAPNQALYRLKDGAL